MYIVMSIIFVYIFLFMVFTTRYILTDFEYLRLCIIDLTFFKFYYIPLSSLISYVVFIWPSVSSPYYNKSNEQQNSRYRHKKRVWKMSWIKSRQVFHYLLYEQYSTAYKTVKVLRCNTLLYWMTFSYIHTICLLLLTSLLDIK